MDSKGGILGWIIVIIVVILILAFFGFIQIGIF